VTDWDPAGDLCRPLAGQLLGTLPDEVALIPAVSVGASVILAQFGPGDEILVPDDEFASVLLPALVASRARGVVVRRVKFEALAEEVSPVTRLVATSQVRSRDGVVQNLEDVVSAAREVGASVLVDATHAAGILPVRAKAIGLDYVLCAAYKHLLCPRGVAFMCVGQEHWDSILPMAASWRSAEDPYAHYYGPDLAVLAATAARFDVSLAWHAWVGAVAALEFLCSVDGAQRQDWAVGLASAVAKPLDLPATGSSVLTVPVSDGDRAREELTRWGIKASGRGDSIRVSFHLYNDQNDAAKVVECLLPFVRPNPDETLRSSFD
jgi:selenocysteine lyase/cysteine desulfurase